MGQSPIFWRIIRKHFFYPKNRSKKHFIPKWMHSSLRSKRKSVYTFGERPRNYCNSTRVVLSNSKAVSCPYWYEKKKNNYSEVFALLLFGTKSVIAFLIVWREPGSLFRSLTSHLRNKSFRMNTRVASFVFQNRSKNQRVAASPVPWKMRFFYFGIVIQTIRFKRVMVLSTIRINCVPKLVLCAYIARVLYCVRFWRRLQVVQGGKRMHDNCTAGRSGVA